jgi:hypothetical protein
VNRLRLIADLHAVGDDVAVVRTVKARSVAGRRRGFAVRVTLTPTGLDARRVTIAFAVNSPDTPQIYVPGPGSPHRYDDDSLCIWYPGDPPSQRWRWYDGGIALAGHICAHLIREAWWHQTGEWVGEEVPHSPQSPLAWHTG